MARPRSHRLTKSVPCRKEVSSSRPHHSSSIRRRQPRQSNKRQARRVRLRSSAPARRERDRFVAIAFLSTIFRQLRRRVSAKATPPLQNRVNQQNKNRPEQFRPAS